jgi:hypothetical protein
VGKYVEEEKALFCDMQRNLVGVGGIRVIEERHVGILNADGR